MQRYNTLDWIGWALATIGAINWGLRGIADFNLVHALFGRYPLLERTIYSLVGISGLMSLVRFFQYSSETRPLEHIELGR